MMPTPNHAPGDWAVAFNDRGHGHGDYGVIETAGGTLVAKVETGLYGDACRLAAAPALLKLHREVIDQMDAQGYINLDLGTRIKAAIASAAPDKRTE